MLGRRDTRAAHWDLDARGRQVNAARLRRDASAARVAGVGVRGDRETLRRAGLAGEPDVRPVSVAAWAGAQILEETGQIEAVARALGMRSLDRAARLIGWDWTHRDRASR